MSSSDEIFSEKPVLQQVVEHLDSLGLTDGEIITAEQLNPFLAKFSLEAATSAAKTFVGRRYISPDSHQANVEYLSDFEPPIEPENR